MRCQNLECPAEHAELARHRFQTMSAAASSAVASATDSSAVASSAATSDPAALSRSLECDLTPTIVGISGKIGAGKDEIAKILKRKAAVFSDPRTVHKSYARELRKYVAFMTGLSVEFLETHEGKNTYCRRFKMTAGEVMQKVGVAFRNTFGPDIWIDLATEDFDPKASKWIFTDVRFPNEAQWIKDHGGIVVRTNGDPSGERARSKRDLNAVSETALDDYKSFDAVITNDGTLLDLQKKVVEQVVVPLLGADQLILDESDEGFGQPPLKRQRLHDSDQQ